MQRFLARIIVFIALVLITFGTAIMYACHQLNRESIYQLEPLVNTVIIGDSHTQYGIDAGIFPNVINLSNSADSYLFSYLKLRRLFKHNAQIRRVFLGFSGHNLSMPMENWNFKDENLRNKTAQYLSLMSSEEVVLFLRRNPVAFLVGAVKFPKAKAKVLLSLSDGSKVTEVGFGRYENLTRQFDNSNNGRRLVKSSAKPEQLSPSQLHYLQKILSLCETHDVELILVSTPLHNTYPKELDKAASDYYRENLDAFKWLHLTSISLPDSCFADYEHLNVHGASYFTKLISGELLGQAPDEDIK